AAAIDGGDAIDEGGAVDHGGDAIDEAPPAEPDFLAPPPRRTPPEPVFEPVRAPEGPLESPSTSSAPEEAPAVDPSVRGELERLIEQTATLPVLGEQIGASLETFGDRLVDGL